MADPLAQIEHLETAWRSLSTAERPRAEYYLGVASRRVRRRWPNVDTRIANEDLGVEDVRDVVVHMVLQVLDGPPVRGAKSWSETRGPLSQSLTLESGKAELITIEDWMVEVFENAGAVKPVGSFPQAGRYESLFQWPEVR